MKFSLQVDKAVDNMADELEKTARGTLLEIYRRSIQKTPIVTGRLRSNWQTNIGSEPTGEKDIGHDSMSMANKVMTSFSSGDTVYFANNLPYAVPIENGHSQKNAPRGMLKLSVFEVTGVLL